MELKVIITRCRSYRRFFQDHKIDKETLRELVDLARLSSSSANLQPLKYILSAESSKNKTIFETLAWAGYIKDWPGPCEGERPSAYIVILGDRDISQTFGYDCGIAAQTILLGAVEKNLGGCMIGSIKRDLLKKKLNIADQYEILLVIALGRPKEKITTEKVSNGNIKYYRDKDQVHHVPKRSLDDIIIGG